MSITALPPVAVPPIGKGPERREDEWVQRFGRTERFAHWWTVAMLLVALFTGLSLGDDSRSGFMFYAHVGSVVLIALGLIAAATLGDHRALLAATRELFGFDGRDLGWLRSHARHPFRHHPEPAWGMFNAGQKMLGWALSAAVSAVIVTGLLASGGGGDGGGGLHGVTVVITLILLAAHIFMAVLNPATRPALAGMVFGRVRRTWAATHHSDWLKEKSGTTKP